VTANACYPLPTTTKQDMKKYGVSEEFVNRNPRYVIIFSTIKFILIIIFDIFS